MKSIIAIGTGSFIGGVLRYLLSQFIDAKFPSAFFFGTLCVNVAGCFAIGMVFALADTSYINDDWRLFLPLVSVAVLPLFQRSQMKHSGYCVRVNYGKPQLMF